MTRTSRATSDIISAPVNHGKPKFAPGKGKTITSGLKFLHTKQADERYLLISNVTP
ncbi:MAG: hypothetical protein ISS69_09615 [Phycisphaerae bacterium]|nr:hypothetical protein [Phycisphaerae bacterium]